MVLYNKYKFRQQAKQKKKKSLDNPVVNEASELNFQKPNIDYLLNLKKQLEAREAHVSNIAMKRRLLEGQHKANYEMEMSRLREEMHNPRIPETSLEHLKNRYDKLEKLSSAVF